MMRRTSSYSVADKKNESGNDVTSDATLKRFRQLRFSGKQRADHCDQGQRGEHSEDEVNEHEHKDRPAELVTDLSLRKSTRQEKAGVQQRKPLFSRRFSEPGKVIMSTGQRFHRSQSQVDQTMLNKQILQERGC
ncbi:uncharacterized protein LOC133190429 [Saccostrea echinata]|uniref:uncharacterized protein LOC133190429 n=1 Tax=Saccostrea echinata TaxID=191078 RepID=UPI002A81EB7A|nr:uncharacterized protein LOC133190429 [Saccostrea echinata]